MLIFTDVDTDLDHEIILSMSDVIDLHIQETKDPSAKYKFKDLSNLSQFMFQEVAVNFPR